MLNINYYNFFSNYKIFCLLCVNDDGSFSLIVNLIWGNTKAIGLHVVIALLSWLGSRLRFMLRWFFAPSFFFKNDICKIKLEKLIKILRMIMKFMCYVLTRKIFEKFKLNLYQWLNAKLILWTQLVELFFLFVCFSEQGNCN